jgi:hypothetical protein
MTDDPGAVECVASEILRYLERRPKASDTLEGIVDWWLPRIRLEEAAERVREALELLEERSLIEQVQLTPRRVLYRRVSASDESGGSHA